MEGLSIFTKVLLSAGGILVAIGVWYVLFLHTKLGKSLPGVVWFTVFLVGFIGIVGPWAIDGLFWGAGRLDNSWNQNVTEYASKHKQLVDPQEVLDRASAWLNFESGSGGSENSTYVIDNDGGGGGSGESLLDSETAPEVVRLRVKKDAMTIWLRKITILAGGDLTPGQNPGISMAQFPENSSVAVKCNSCVWGKAKENWTIAVVPAEGDVDPITFEVDGYFARNLGIDVDPNTIKSGVGTGSWPAICSDCVEKVASTAGTDEAPTTGEAPGTEEAPAEDPGSAPEPPGDKSVVINDTKDPSGAWYYTPATDSSGTFTCVGIDQTHDGTIPNQTTVTSVQMFPGAGWIDYLNSKDLLLVDWDGKNVCVFAGTVQ